MKARIAYGLRGTAVLSCLVCFLAVLAETRTIASAPGVPALDYGFRFATAIETADKNKAMAQQLVTLDYGRIGELDRAVMRADQVLGWRRGVAYAELAAEMVQRGQADDARALIARAEEVRAAADEWYPLRISAHVAHSLALLGEVEMTRQIAARLAEADARQYSGRAVATVALALAVRGDFDEALELMASLDEAEDFDLTLWRTEGYLEIGTLKRLNDDQRRRALEEARLSAAGVQSWNQMELLGRIGEELYALGRAEAAVETLQNAEAMARSVPADMPSKAALVAMVAGSWTAIGQQGRTIELLESGAPAIDAAMSIEQPGIHARIAGLYALAGDDEKSRKHFASAFTISESLTNARPRALAVVAICRELGRSGIALDSQMRSRLDRLFKGLDDPW